MKLKKLEYRDEALKQLKKYFYALLSETTTRNKIVFKAPTGSGKTVTMACLLRELTNELPQKYDLPNNQVAFIWIAPNELHLQSFRSLQGFFEETRDIDCIQYEDITDEKLKANELLFLNWQSISSEDNLFVRENETDKNIFTYIENTKQAGVEVVIIIDEAHLFGTKGEKAVKFLNKVKAKIEIDVSATPLTDSDFKVVIPRADVVKEQMIKKGVQLNPQLKIEEQGERELNIMLLDKAIAKRNELAKKYKEQNTNINPLLLIQLPNDKSEKLSDKDNEIKQTVIDYLKTKGITTDNHKLAVWLSKKEDKLNLDDISKNDNMVEVLLFKQAIALGWDCPRASILVIFRELKQETFAVQTLGRILRMPEQKHYTDGILNIGYVYTNLSKDIVKIEPESTDYITMNTSYRKKIYNNLNLISFYSIGESIKRNRIGLQFKEALFLVAEKRYEITKESEDATSFYFSNIEKMKIKNVEMKVGKIDIEIPVDMNIDVTSIQDIKVEYKSKFARTLYELMIMFDRFCLDNCGEYQKDGSWERIKYHLKLLFEEYFAYDEKETIKVILKNEQEFIDLLNLAREEYERILHEEAKKRKIEIKEQKWEVPEELIFNEKYVDYPATAPIMEPLYLLNRGNQKVADSDNEQQFIEFLETAKNLKQIKWWYKNGSHGMEHFAIPYNETHLFYVDFVIQFNDDSLGLFDPKTKESDIAMVDKHNALIDYILERNKEGKKIIGGIVLNKDNSWRYSKEKIKNGYDVKGWEVFI